MQRKIIPGTPLLLSGLLVLSSCGAQKHVAVSDPAFDYSTSFPATQHLPKEFSGIRYRAEIVGYGPDGKQVKVIQVSPDYALAAFGGVLLGRDGGEWGGELVFRKRDGTVQRILEQDVHGIFQMPFGVAVFTGLAHLHANHGRLYVIFRNQRGTISARLRQSLPGAPSDVFRTTEGDLVFRILSARFKRQGGFLTPVKDCYLLKKSGIVMALSCSAVAKAPSPKWVSRTSVRLGEMALAITALSPPTNQAMDGRVGVSFPALSRCRSDDAERASKARLFEHKDVRVRAGAREARSKGSRADTTSARPSRPREWLWLLSPKGK